MMALTMWPRPLRVVLGLLVLLTSLASFGPSAQAQFKTKAQFAFLMDADTGAVLFEKNADELMPPASMSKLMTLEVLFKALKDGQVSLEDEFYVSEHAWRKGGGPSGTSAMFLKLNSREKLSEIMRGIIVQSGNDAAIVLAEGMAGSEEAFARMMTERAREIGLKKSTFANPTGLPDPDQLMTARELALLALHIMKEYPDYYKLFAEKRYNYKRYKFVNRNPLLYLDIGVDGLKTGYTKEAGYGLVASARQRGRRLILVINGLKSKRERKEEGRRLLEWGFRNFKAFKLFDAGEVVGDARVWGGDRFYLPLVGKGEISILLPRFGSDKRKLKAWIAYKGPLKAPIRKGDEVAVLRVRSSNAAVSEFPLYAAVDVKRTGIVSRGIDSLLHMALGWIL